MNSKREQELEDYPKYREMYLRSFEKMLQARRNAGLATEWDTPENVMQWWIGANRKPEKRFNRTLLDPIE